MFCFQCQETAKGSACTIAGVCGKTPDVANLQDLLIHVAKGISTLADLGRKEKLIITKADKYVFESLFTTITNANFDQTKILAKIKEGFVVRDFVREELSANSITLPEDLPKSTSWKAEDDETLLAYSELVGVLQEKNEDIRSLKELLIYG
ncbi:MAG: hydroxylamine reductase, partial [Candidatus Marinimicrobia bacterium]|nr:hydroxylamine reductase [Candidatus Neomarinimicrobiota bacterium]